MLKLGRFCLLFICIHSLCYAQDSTETIVSSSPTESSSVQFGPEVLPSLKATNENNFKPTVGFSTGMMSFYGDLYEKNFQSPTAGRIAQQLFISQKIYPFLELRFNTLYGKLGANERLADRHLNFESRIIGGGIELIYNFDHFLPQERKLSPFVSLGIEGFEFLSKTDLYDQFGSKYYYWSDRTIRNKDESDPDAKNAIMIQRDYKYESDIRELDLDGFGKYPERSFAIPFGIGGIIHLTRDVDFSMGMTFHYTFTDYIDGITDESIGVRKGNSRNDMFVVSSFSLSYNISGWGRSEGDTLPPGFFDEVDFYALETADEDGDGVPDTADYCANTPENAEVDSRGCPIDTDNDGIPDYRDQQKNSPANAIVNVNGVQYTDSMLAALVDTGGAYTNYVVQTHEGKRKYANSKEFAVLLGEYSEGIPPEQMTKFLSIPDLATNVKDDSITVYTAGKYSSYAEAETRKEKLAEQGMEAVTVVYKKGKNYVVATAADENKVYIPPTGSAIASTSTSETQTENPYEAEAPKKTIDITEQHEDVIFRIQLGAYKSKLSENVFLDVGDLVEVRTEGGLYKYMVGSFNTFEEAAQYKAKLITKGFSGAFITGYQEKERVGLSRGGATFINKNEKEDLTEKDEINNVLEKDLVQFKVQVGYYQEEPPADISMKFQWLNALKQEKTKDGYTRYVVGNLSDYAEAEKLKSDIVKNYEIQDAFIIAFFKNRYISIKEAREIMENMLDN